MKYTYICLSLLIGFFVGDAVGQSVACSDCIYGVAALDGSGSDIVRFANNTSDAATLLSNLQSAGFTAHTASKACNISVCGSNSVCSVNTTDIFVCDCEDQYSPSRETQQFTCSDTNECTEGTHNCTSSGGVCTNLTPGFSCSCAAGYSGDGYNCSNIDECDPNPCATNATCDESVPNNYTCACDSGFTGDGYTTCSDIDECVNGSSPCDSNATCSNSVGGHTCTCNAGYSGNGTTCEDINDCASNPCHTNADCTDLVNNHTCACKTGFSGDGVTLCEKTREDLNVTFTITCESLTFSTDLQDPSHSAYANVTSAIAAAMRTFVTGVDNGAGVVSISYSFVNSTDGLGSAQTEVTVLINNTNQLLNDYLTALSNLQESVECGAKASTDECALGTDNCGTGQSCSNTPYGFCCYTDFDFLGSISYNNTFLPAMDNITSSVAIDVFNDAIDVFLKKLGNLNTRGCSHSVTFEHKKVIDGSTIAVLQLKVVNATFTPQDLANEMAKAENSTTSFGTIIGAGDFDACAASYEADRNCSAFATCTNFIGGFSCDCNSTYYDNGTNASGEICIVPVTVSCSGSAINVSILADYYATRNVNLTSLHLADHACNFTTHSTIIGDSIQFELDINACNTTLTTDANTSAIVASNIISNVPAAGFFTGDAIEIPFQCQLPASLNITVGLNGTPSVVDFPAVVTDGAFNLQFSLFQSSSFQNAINIANTVFTSTDTIYGQIEVLNQINNVGVFVSECWGTPTNNRADTEKVIFIANGCPVGNSVQGINIIRNGDSSARMNFQMFYFTQFNSLYLHCDVSVCTPSCTQTCSKRRRKRSEPVERSNGVTITLRLRLDPNDPNFNVTEIEIGGLEPKTPNNNISINDITLPIVAAILAFLLIIILIVVVVVVFRKQRAKKNDYDLTHVNMHAIAVKPPNYEQ